MVSFNCYVIIINHILNNKSQKLNILPIDNLRQTFKKAHTITFQKIQL